MPPEKWKPQSGSGGAVFELLGNDYQRDKSGDLKTALAGSLCQSKHGREAVSSWPAGNSVDARSNVTLSERLSRVDEGGVGDPPGMNSRRVGRSHAEIIIRGIGALCTAVGIFSNEWIQAWLFEPDRISPSDLVLLRIFSWSMLSWGVVLAALYGRSLVRKLNVSFLSLIAALGSCEIFLERFDLRVDDPYLHHTLKKSASATIWYGTRKTLYVTNSLGFRDRTERNVTKISRAKTRILMLGDSFAASLKVNYEDSFVHKLETRLKQEGKDVEILNAAVTSYSPSLEYRKLRQFLDQGYKTDVVICLLDVSDIHDEGVVYPNWESSFRRPLILRFFFPRLVRLYRMILSEVDEASGTSPRASWTELDPALPQNAWIGRGIESGKESLSDIAELCRKSAIDFRLVIYPWPHQIKSRKRPSPHEQIFREFAKVNDIVLYDLFPAFYSLSNWEDFFIERDSHWNEQGHSLVADLIYQYVIRDVSWNDEKDTSVSHRRSGT